VRTPFVGPVATLAAGIFLAVFGWVLLGFVVRLVVTMFCLGYGC
jgi:hypothetical protein